MAPKSCGCLPSGFIAAADHLLPAGHAARRATDLRMTAHEREHLALALRQEAAFLASGAYGKFVRTPDVPSPLFKRSPICINDGKSGPCDGCVLMQLVPRERRDAAIPCHYIPLNERGETVHSLAFGPQREVEMAVRKWLAETIQHLEAQA